MLYITHESYMTQYSNQVNKKILCCVYMRGNAPDKSKSMFALLV